jgi:hypothetical protein
MWRTSYQKQLCISWYERFLSNCPLCAHSISVCNPCATFNGMVGLDVSAKLLMNIGFTILLASTTIKCGYIPYNTAFLFETLKQALQFFWIDLATIYINSSFLNQLVFSSVLKLHSTEQTCSDKFPAFFKKES